MATTVATVLAVIWLFASPLSLLFLVLSREPFPKGWTARIVIALNLCFLFCLSALMLWIDTRYSDNYSEAAFNRVRAGMSRNAVDSLLGQPLSVTKKGAVEERWYSSQRFTTAWHMREINLSNDVVVRITKSIDD